MKPSNADGIIRYVERTVHLTSERMPYYTEADLPVTNKRKVYESSVQKVNIHRSSEIYPTCSNFISLWKHQCPLIKIIKKSGFQKCSECERIHV